MKPFYRRPDYLPEAPPPVTFERVVQEQSNKSGIGIEGDVISKITPNILKKLGDTHHRDVLYSRNGAAHFLIFQPQTVSEVLVDKATSFTKGEEELALAKALGWGLLVDEGPSHRDRQTQIGPAFRGAALEQYVEAVSRVASMQVASLRNHNATPLLDWARNFAQHAAEKSLFPSVERKPNYQFGSAIRHINELAFRNDWERLSAPEALRETRVGLTHRQFLADYVMAIIDDWRENSRTDPTLMDYIVGDSHEDMEVGSSVHAQVALFMQAAMETTGSLLSWGISSLAARPDVWAQLVAEARDQRPESAYENIQLPVMRSVLEETLRQYPPAWLLPRIAAEDVEVGGFLVPKGSRLVVSPWVTHRDAQTFVKPDEFLPSRWSDTFRTSLPRGAYYPFGLGKRICVGERFARLNASILLRELALTTTNIRLSQPASEVHTCALIANISPDITLSLMEPGEPVS